MRAPLTFSAMKELYALVYRTTASQEEFDARIPRLMEWLRDLYADGKLRGCGGGEWKNEDGAGLTIIEAENRDEIEAIAARNPMNEIGTTEIMQWGVFFGDLNVKEREEMLKR